MKTLIRSLKALAFLTLAASTLTASTALAAEQSYPVTCGFYEGTNVNPAQRSGDLLIQSVNGVHSLRLRTTQNEYSITVRRGFEVGNRGSEATVQALELDHNTEKYILFFRNAVSIRYTDLGKQPSAMVCQSSELPVIADKLIGTDEGTMGPMQASLIQATNGAAVSRRPRSSGGSTTVAAQPTAPASSPIPGVQVSTIPGVQVSPAPGAEPASSLPLIQVAPADPTVVENTGVPASMVESLSQPQ